MVKNALIAVYILAVLAISAIARAGVLPNNASGEEVSSAEAKNYNFKTHVGEIVALADGSLVLAMEDQQTFFSVKSQLDLTPFIGFKVMVSGIELEHQLAPNFELESVDPLPGFGSGNKTIVFFVLGISEVR